MIVKGSYENHIEINRLQPVEEIEGIPLRHFNIHKNQVRLGVLDDFDRSPYSIRRSDHFHLRTIGLQQRLQYPVTVCLVIYENGSYQRSAF